LLSLILFSLSRVRVRELIELWLFFSQASSIPSSFPFIYHQRTVGFPFFFHGDMEFLFSFFVTISVPGVSLVHFGPCHDHGRPSSLPTGESRRVSFPVLSPNGLFFFPFYAGATGGGSPSFPPPREMMQFFFWQGYSDLSDSQLLLRALLFSRFF